MSIETKTSIKTAWTEIERLRAKTVAWRKLQQLDVKLSIDEYLLDMYELHQAWAAWHVAMDADRVDDETNGIPYVCPVCSCRCVKVTADTG